MEETSPIEAPLLVEPLEEPEGPPIEGVGVVVAPEKKEPKKLSKRAKLIIIISSIIIGVAAVGALLYYFIFSKKEPEVILSDRDILVSHAWEKQDAPTVIWTFYADGTGELTTNKSNYYNIKWQLLQEDKSLLNIDTEWLYELNDSFEFVLNRENNSFVVKNLADEKESVFVPLGTAEQQSKNQSDELEKSE